MYEGLIKYSKSVDGFFKQLYFLVTLMSMTIGRTRWTSFTQFERFLSKTIFDYPQNRNILTIWLQVLLQDTHFKKHFFDKIYQKCIVFLNMF
jgi:hypothetical protein